MTKALHLDERYGLHERAISASLHLLYEDQVTVPSIVAIAEEMQVEPAELQTTFNNSSDVYNAAAEQAFVRLIDRATKAMIRLDQDDYFGQFRALGEAYLEWAHNFPLHFQLIADRKLVNPDEDPNLNRYKKSIFEVLRKILSRARDAGTLHPAENIEQLIYTSQSFVKSLARDIVQDADPDEALEAAQAIFSDYVMRCVRNSENR